MLKQFLFITTILSASLSAAAYDFCADGIYYSIISEELKQVAVVCGNTGDSQAAAQKAPARDIMMWEYKNWPGNSYAGDISIPETVSPKQGSEPYTVTEIGMGTFWNCPELTSILLPKTISYIGTGAFDKCTALSELIIPDNVTRIGEAAFRNCSSLERIQYSAGCNYIPNYGFTNAGNTDTGLTITAVEHVTRLDIEALSGSAIREFNIHPDMTCDMGALYGSSIEKAVIPEFDNDPRCGGFLGNLNFGMCKQLKHIDLPSTVADYPELPRDFVGSDAISHIIIRAVTPPKLSSDWADEVAPGCVLEVPAEALSAYRNAEYWKNFSDIRAIGSAAAYDFCADGIYYSIISEELKQVAVVCGNTDDSQAAAQQAPSRDITLWEYENWPGNSYFGDITIPETIAPEQGVEPYTVTEIGMGAFWKCSDLTSVTLPETITYIGVAAFRMCTSLTEIAVPNSVTSIGEAAFSNCSALEHLEYSDKCDYLPDYVLSSSGNPESGLTISGAEHIKAINIEALSGSAIREFNIAPDMTCNMYAFYGSMIESVTIPRFQDDAKCGNFLGGHVFDMCKQLQSIELPDNLTDLSGLPNGFQGCDAVTHITIHTITPPKLWSDWAAEVAPDCVLEVPAEALEAYQNADYWKNFSEIRAIGGAAVEEVRSAVSVTTERGVISVAGTDCMTVTDMTGRIIYQGAAGSISVACGVYLVHTGTDTCKVLVK